MRGLKSYYYEHTDGLTRYVKGYIPLAKVPGKFVRFFYSYVTKNLKYEKENFLIQAYKEALLIHFNMEATHLDQMLTIEQIEDKSRIFGYPEFSEMIQFISDK